MKIRYLLLVGLAGCLILSGCSPEMAHIDTPEHVFKEYQKDLQTRDVEDAIKLINPDDVSERGKEWAKRWIELHFHNIKSVKLEDMAILGGTARSRVKLIYKDGTTKESKMFFIRNNGAWYISPNFSFGGE